MTAATCQTITFGGSTECSKPRVRNLSKYGRAWGDFRDKVRRVSSITKGLRKSVTCPRTPATSKSRAEPVWEWEAANRTLVSTKSLVGLGRRFAAIFLAEQLLANLAPRLH